MQNYYENLGISYDANSDEICRAIAKKRKRFKEDQNRATSLEEGEKYDTELFFLKKIEATLLDSEKKKIYDQKLSNRSQKRKLDSNQDKVISDYSKFDAADHKIPSCEANIYIGRFIHGVIINQISVSKHKISKSKVYFSALLMVLYRIALLLISFLLIYSFGFWGALLLFIWIFREVRNTPMSEVAKKKRAEFADIFNKLLKNLKIILGIEKIKQGSKARKYFAVRDQKNNVYTIRVRGQLLRGSLNVGDQVKLWCFGWGNTAYFLSGKNLRNKLSLQFS